MRFALTAIRITRHGLDFALAALIMLVLLAILLARIVPMVSGAPVFVVGGASMEPAIHLGSVAIDHPVAATSLSVGDVISLKVGPQQAVFTHRITRLVTREDGLWIETKGDNNAATDPSLLPASAVLGRVQMVIPMIGFLVQVLSTPSGMALVFMLGALLLGLAFAVELVEEELIDLQQRHRPVWANALLRHSGTEPGATG